MTGSLVIVNPNASRLRDAGRREQTIRRLRESLAARDGSAPRILATSTQEETYPAVKDALAEGVPAVVGVGGDGTLRQIAAALSGSGVPMGIMPGGTGNLLAGILGLPASLDGAITALEDARSRTIDLGSVRLRFADGADPEGEATFAIGCGAGFDAHVMASTPSGLKRRFGRTAYFAQALWLATTIEAVPYRISVDGATIETDASIALIANMGELVPGLLGPRLPIEPDDGLLDLIVVGARGPLHGMKGLIDQLVRSHLGGASGSDSLRVRGRVISVEADRPEPLQVDGDHVGDGSLEARIVASALDVLVPGPRS